MKKNLMALSLMGAIALALSVPTFAFEEGQTPPEPPAREGFKGEFKGNFKGAPPHFNKEEQAKKKAEFEKRLNLTDEQKAKAKEIRQKGHEEMKPVMEAIKAKHQELKVVKETTTDEAVKAQEIEKIKKDIGELHKKAHEERMKNMKEFESILTKKQLKELDKMKEEGRKNFEKNHPQRKRPDFNGKKPTAPLNSEK